VPDAGDVAGMEAAKQGVGIGIGIFGKALDRAINGKPTPPPTRTVIVAPPVTSVTVPTISATMESRLIAALDRNHDGVIDEEEIQLAPLSLKKLDLNLDGILTSDEYMGVKTIIASTPVVTQPIVVAAPATPEVVVTPVPVPAPLYEPVPHPQPHPVPPPRGPRPPHP
jgi:hypothetical protein